MHRSSSGPVTSSLPPIGRAGEGRVGSGSSQRGRNEQETTGNAEEFVFPVLSETVCDLLVGSMGDTEVRNLQDVLVLHRVYLEQLYCVVGKSRCDFAEFVTKASGIDDQRMANEIFSIATDRFAAQEDALGHGSDCTMSRKQFTTAMIRVANLCSLINHGMAHSLKLSNQMNEFILQAKEARC